MSFVSKFFGFSKIVVCDRCGSEEGDPWDGWYTLCDGCFSIPTSSIRHNELNKRAKEKVVRPGTIACSRCGRKTDTSSLHHVCFRCHSEHPDKEHDGKYGTSWNKLPKNDKPTVTSCHSCGGLVVRSPEADGSITHTYYRVGCREPNLGPFGCPKSQDPNWNVSDLTDIQKECTHDWQCVLDATNSPEERRRIEKSLGHQKRSGPGMIQDMLMGVNTSALAEGYYHQWCWKCGYYQVINPSRLDSLPVKGVCHS